jgi:hypothetical protein
VKYVFLRVDIDAMKRLLYQLVILLLILGCRLSNGVAISSTTPEQGQTFVHVSVSTTEPAHSSDTLHPISSPQSTMTFEDIPTSTSTQSIVSGKNNTPTVVPISIIQPTIHEGEGKIYSVLFSISVGDGADIKYRGGGDIEINGPNAIAVLPDGSIIVSDIVGNRLLKYDQAGKLLKIIDLEEVGIFNVVDLRVKENEIYLLEISGSRYRVDRITPDGNLISSDEFPPNFPIGESGLTLANVLTGIAVDCGGNILLEIANGSELFRLVDIRSSMQPSEIVKDYYCNEKKYRVTNPGPKGTPKIIAGNIILETELTTGLGGFQLLDVLDDGSLFIIREDVVNEQVIKVDQTLHFIDANGIVRGMSRIPASEFLYYVMRSIAIESTGEVLALIPRPNSIDIVRLIFYEQLEPLIPEAVKPNITISISNP